MERTMTDGTPHWARGALPAAVLCLFCLLAAPAARAATEPAGLVLEITPGAFVERGWEKIPLELKAPVQAGDTLITDATGRLRVLMEDDTALSFGAHTSFTLESYQAEGRNPEFKGRLAQGLLRALTGKITEMNPQGFALTTPEATVGIRGTMLTLRSENGRSTVLVENTLRRVLVNGMDVPGGYQIAIAPGLPPDLRPIEPADRRRIGRDLAAVGRTPTAAAAPEPGMAAPSPMTNLQAGTRTTLAGLAVNDLRAPDLPLTPALPLPLPPPTASVSGMLNLSSYVLGYHTAGEFGFQVDLSSGAISGGYLDAIIVNFDPFNPPMDLYGYYTLSGGTGLANASGFTVGGLSGNFTATPLAGMGADETVAGTMGGTDNLLTAPDGGNVTGWFNLVPLTNSPDSGVLSGVFHNPALLPLTPGMGHIAGEFTSIGGVIMGALAYGGCGFAVNLASGAISQATMYGLNTNIEYLLRGGTGALSGGAAHISGFSGEIIVSGTPFTAPPGSYMDVAAADVSFVGGAVSGTYSIDGTGTTAAPITDDGSFSGRRIR
jgi:hypothetical protein